MTDLCTHNQDHLGRRVRFLFLAVVLLGMGLVLAILWTVPVAARRSTRGIMQAPVAPAYAHLVPSDGEVAAGQIITVDLHVDSVANLYGAQFTLGFSPDIAAVVDADAGKPGIQIQPGDCLATDIPPGP